jgi:hypothetical protein
MIKDIPEVIRYHSKALGYKVITQESVAFYIGATDNWTRKF